MSARDYDALLLDLDGTLLDDQSLLSPRTSEALREASAQGVRVMVATGRSNLSAHGVLAELGLDAPAIVFNGAGLYCHRRQRLLEERTLSNRTLARTLEYAHARAHLPVVMCADRKLALAPRDAAEEAALALMTGLRIVSREELLAEYVMRVTLFSTQHASSDHFAAELEAAVGLPLYTTHFPLNALASHRSSPLHVLDIHPPCRGKGEALRVLEELYGIQPARVVAVGDATNDIPMFELAGLSVAMENSMSEALAVAQRVIGSNNGPAIAELVEELFLAPARPIAEAG
jgi:Cof subfamily protein (haloacid dehalogenase superfamily)